MRKAPGQSDAGKRGRLDRLIRALRENKGTASPAAVIPRRDPSAGSPPLSPGQRRLYLLHELESDAAAYTIAGLIRLQGSLDLIALQRAIGALVGRHAPLRTTFAPLPDGDEPVQHVADLETIPALAIVDLTRVVPEGISLDRASAEVSDDEGRDAQIRALARQWSCAPFDLARGPLMRLALLRIDEQDHRLVLAMHHLIADGWSLGVLVRDLAAGYDRHRADNTVGAEVSANQPDPGPLAVSYGDYAAWQYDRLKQPEIATAIDRACQRLAGVPVLELPADRPRPATIGLGATDQDAVGAGSAYAGSSVESSLDMALLDRLDAFSRECGATLFMALLAAFSACLSRITGQQDFAIGSPFAGRNRRELESLVGFFVDTLVARVDLGGQPGFSQLLARAKDALLAAEQDQDVPFETLAARLQATRDPTISPLFQVMLTVDRETPAAVETEALSFQPEPIYLPISKFDLTLAVTPRHQQGREHGLERTAVASASAARWVFKTALFDHETIRRFDQVLVALLRAALDHPEQPVALLPVLSASDRQMLLQTWSRTEEHYPVAATLHELVIDQAARTPDAVALALDGETRTYGELVAGARAFATFLRARGAGPEAIVGVCMQRSFDLIEAILGVFQAGGAYLPLDPDLPLARLSAILDDACVDVVVVEPGLVDTAAADTESEAEDDSDDRPASGSPTAGPLVACLAGDGKRQLVTAGARSTEDDHDPATVNLPTIEADHPAYVIYTSGSTGRPKGVVVTHGAAANRLRWVRAVELGPDTRFLLKTTISFDVSIVEMFAPLVVGGRVVLARPGGQRDTDYLIATIAAAGITVTSFPPSLLRLLLSDPAFVRCRELRTVITGGETVPADLPDAFYQRFTSASLENRYGPTEATISVTRFACPNQGEAGPIPIGRPIAKAEVYVLDRELAPVPIGVNGELYLGGPSLARGYLARPARTAEAFVPHPFTTVEGGRLYRTGDVVRWRSDGNLVFIGRIDQQVKIRGFRVELAEIEIAIRDHPGVQEAAVIDLPDGDSRRLAAYWVATASPCAVDDDALLAWLGERLPEHMVPAAIVALEALPVTASGKVDRSALPAPNWRARAAAYEAPATDTEQRIAAVWQELLGVPQVGRHDDFFTLGGHSLLAGRVATRLRALFEVSLPLRSLFEHPTLIDFAGAVDRAIDLAADQSRRAHSPTTALAPGQIEGGQASRADDETSDASEVLSFGQERMWFLHQLDPESASYNNPGAVRLRGALDYRALTLGLGAVIERHETLRTTFPTVDGTPGLQIAPTLDLPIPLGDLSHLEEAERQAHAEALARQEATTPFDLARGPLLRSRLLRLGADEHLLLVTMHHIVSDGWSVGVLIRELAEAYGQAMRGQQPNLPSLALSYSAWARRARQAHAGRSFGEGLDYWRRQLQGAQRLELPTDLPRPPHRSDRGATLPVRIAAQPTLGLERLAEAEGATLFMVLLAGFQTVLGRWAGTVDVTVGTPVANRDDEATEAMIGFFVNTIALRGDLTGNPSFRALLAQARERALDGFAHQNVPFERVVEAVQPDRDQGSTPLFQVMLVLQNAPMGALTLPGAKAEPISVSSATSKFDLTLYLRRDEAGLTGSLEYSTDLFLPATMQRFLDHFAVLLAAAAKNPAQSLSALTRLPAADRQILATWNDTSTVDVPADCLQARIRAQAARTPDAVALVFDNRSLSFADLVTRAGRLAGELRSHGVGEDVLVGICAERSFELVIGLLAVLEAGGAYVPMDPAYPRARLAFMVTDAGASVLLVQPHLVDRLPPLDDTTTVIALDPDVGSADGGVGGGGEAIATTDVDPDSLAYMIYTSGSTGRPKGAMNRHRGILNRLEWMQERFQLTSRDRVLQKTPMSFDVSVWELFWPLLTGTTMVLAEPEGHKDPDYLSRLIDEQNITFLHFVPSMLQAFLTHDELEARCGSVRQVVCSGEALPYDLQERFFARLPDAELSNLYGPTEAAVDVTDWPCVAGDARRMVPIGKPITHTTIHILDAELEPVPIGAPGQLFIGGIQLARGYHQRSALTARTFVPAPTHLIDHDGLGGVVAGERLYASGDRARWRSDGSVEFLGRIDHQIKIRGLRIELGEIEAVLLENPIVREAVVMPRQIGGAQADTRLVAYLVGHEVDEETLRVRLADQLPEYMVPSAFLVLDALPLNPSGKVDRKALPEPELTTGMRTFEAPVGDLETSIAEIWQQVLDVDRIGRNDTFFELGGHSLLAVQVQTRLRQRIGVDIPLRKLFDAPTVAQQAAILPSAAEAPQDLFEEDETGDDRRRPVGEPNQDDSPLSFGQERLWFLQKLDPESAGYNNPATLRLTGRLDLAAIAHSVQAIVSRHETLRTTFPAEDGKPRLVIAPTLHLPIPLCDLSHLDADERRTQASILTLREAGTPFDLANGPLVRLRVLRLASHEHHLLVTLHHIISDGWSIGVLIRDLVAAYGRAAQGEPPDLPAPEISYSEWARRSRRQRSGKADDEALAFWSRSLRDAPRLALPTDLARPRHRSDRGATLPFRIASAPTADLERLAESASASLFMILLASFQTLLGRWAGSEDVTVGTPVANRHDEATESLIGFFVNTIALRGDLTGNPSFRTLLARVRDHTLEAFAHQRVPFERVVEAVQPARDLGSTPLFQTMLVLQNAPMGTLALPGAEAEWLPLSSATSKLDLTLYLRREKAGLAGSLEFSTDIFKPATVQRFLDQLAALLVAVVDQPDRPLMTLPLEDDATRARQIRLGKGPRRSAPATTLPELFAAQAVRAREREAVCDTAGSLLRYGALADRVDALARRLVAEGVRSESRVALFLGRGVDSVVALLGVLRSGGTYVPLDPDFPSDRLVQIATDADIALVLTTDALIDRLPTRGVPALRLEPADNPGAVPLPPMPDPLAAAYLLYTSGSTGRPKGVVVSHGALANCLLAMAAAPGLEAGERLLAVTTLSFDIAAVELFLPLVVGATTVIATREEAVDGQCLGALLDEHRIDLLQATPATWRLLVATGWQGRDGLRMLCGGEALPIDLAETLHGVHGTLFNMYGPTETTVWSTMDPVLPGKAITVGRPIHQTDVVIVDRHGDLAPTGLAGELLIGGCGLARGYAGRAALTAERFVPDPFATEPGARRYRTGDLARWCSDGRIDCLGRVDNQLKIRGFRIEPGEIEGRLIQHPDIRQAAVVTQDRITGDRRLVAFLVPQPDHQPDTTQVVRHLRASLPEYMVPSAFAVLESLPLTPNGKIDRKALPEPSWVSEAASGDPPRGATERHIAEAFADILGRNPKDGPAISRDDDFFAIGGHSLLAMQLISRLRKGLAVELPLRRIFEHRTPAALAQCLNQGLTQAPAQLPGAVDATAAVAITPRLSDTGPIPLSFAQERLWLVDRLQPGSPAYNIPLALSLRGVLDLEALRASISLLVSRHAVLRTRIRAREGNPYQEIAPQPGHGIKLPTVDLSGLGDRSLHEAQRLATAEAHTPFDLERDSLVRVTIVRTALDEHWLLVTFHHIVIDGWSLHLFQQELVTAYRQHGEHQDGTTLSAPARPSALPALPIQYADYAAWQRRWLAGAEASRQTAFWQRLLSDAPKLLDLPTDRPRHSAASAVGGWLRQTLSPTLVADLEAFSAARGATLYMTLLAGFGILLSRITGQRDFVLGSPVAGRREESVEPLIGLFVNLLPLRLDLTRGGMNREPSVDELIEHVRRITLDAFEHQSLPFERILQTLDIDRNLDTQPLVQVVFQLLRTPRASVDMRGLRIELMAPAKPSVRFDLEIAALDPATTGTTERPLSVNWTYRANLFSKHTIERWADAYECLLEGMVATASRGIRSLPLVSQSERQHLLGPWSGIVTEVPRETTVQKLFAAQAETTPRAIALHQRVPGSSATTLTYAELEAAANRLAHHLRHQGVTRGSSVALCVERGPSMIIAILAIIKADGFYMPIDPAYPNERLAFMLEDTATQLIVVEDHLVTSLPVTPVPMVRLGADAAAIAARPTTPVASSAGPDDLVYVMYTSGSTGRPKGVAAPQSGVVRLVHDTDYIDFSARQTFLHMATPAFDASTFEIWGPLLAGGRLVLAPPGPLDLSELSRILIEQQVTTLFLTSGLFVEMVDNHLEAFAGVEQLLTGGEVMSIPHARRVVEAFPENRFFNVYGPTENTTYTTYFPVPKGYAFDRAMPIGWPIGHSRIFVVDDQAEPVPVGVVGHLLTGGHGLAQGYVRRPALTAAAFIPNPLAATPGERIYRTGDLARFLPDGSLEFLGRGDRQVKVRGFRIEPAEIERALIEHPLIARAAVIVEATPEGGKGKRLLAFLVTEEAGPLGADREGVSGDDLSGSALRAFLGERLPPHMVPSVYFPRDALPLDANGKTDRKALTRLATELLAARTVSDADQVEADEADYVAPTTPAEEAVAEIFQDVLGIARISTHDDFFDLGGHSLLAMRVVARARQALGVDIDLRTLFESPTISALAAMAVARAEDVTLDATEKPPIVALGAPARALSFAQERLWFLDRLEPDSPWYNVPAALRLHGPLDLGALAQALDWVVARHDALRTRFVDQGGAPEAEVVSAEVIAAEWDAITMRVVDLASDQAGEMTGGTRDTRREARTRQVIRTEIQRPFDLARGPLLRTVVLALGPDDHIVVMTLHHIISDEWSIRVLTRELSAAYQALVTGDAPSLPALPIQYGDYAHWQRQWMHGETLEQEVDWWRQHLADAPSLLALPTDRPRGGTPSAAGGVVSLALTPATSQALRALGRERQATTFMVLLAAWASFLGRLSGQGTVVVGTPVANRDRIEVDSLIGFFVNTLAVAVDLGGDPTFDGLLGRVRSLTLGAHAHQDVPFERLVQELAPAREMGYAPIFQTMLVYTEAAQGLDDAAFPGLEIEALPTPTGISKFDLTLGVSDRGEHLELRLVYKSALFEKATIDRLLRQLANLLGEIADSQATRPLSQLSLADPAERAMILGPWRVHAPVSEPDVSEPDASEPDASEPDGRHRSGRYTGSGQSDTDSDTTNRVAAAPVAADLDGLTLHGMVHAQAARTPEAIAVVAGTATLRYGELTRRSARLARHLERQGIGAESVVAVAIERSLALVETLLAVLEAGAAFLPLDPAYPPERLAFMAEDARVAAVLTTTDHAALFGDAATGDPATGDPARPVICIDRDHAAWDDLERVKHKAESDPAGSDRAAYVIYTSGSSGQPKGVVVSHRAVAERLAWVAAHDLTADSAFLQKTTINFDVAVAEIFGPLVAGARTVLVAAGMTADTQALARLIREQGITHTSFPPTLLAALLDEPDLPRQAASLRTIITGGETVPPSLPARVAARLPEVVVENRYGPTEATISVSAWQADPAVPEMSLPIGHPIAGAELYIAGAAFAPTAVGEPGEIVIGGSCVARGYLGRPGQTAAVFVPDPWSGRPGARVYRTGDLGRWRADGAIEFIGRRDAQVKIRGFRVELGEIEAVLDRHPAVDEAAVVDVAAAGAASVGSGGDQATRDGSGDRRLIACVTLHGTTAGAEPTDEPDDEHDNEHGEDAASSSISAWAREKLPAHQVPSAFLPVDALPTTATGKVDRHALRDLVGISLRETAEEQQGEPPRTPLEIEIAAIWSEALAVAVVGRDTSFFDLGGHSLLATRVMARLRQRFGVDLPLRTLFARPTVSRLAQAIAAVRPELEGSPPDGETPDDASSAPGHAPRQPVEHRRIDVGSCELALTAAGSGAATVVFESGLGDAGDVWAELFASLTDHARVVRYDRAGLGASGPSAAPRTAKQISDELQRALEATNEAPPYVLVAHSAGAWFAIQFAAHFPDLTAGLVLIDPTPFVPLAEDGAQTNEDDTLDRQRAALATAHASAGQRAEWRDRALSRAEASTAELPNGLPIHLLSATGTRPTGAGDPGEGIRHDRKIALHRAWLANRENVDHTVIDAGHDIHLEQSEQVRDIIRGMLNGPSLAAAGRVAPTPAETVS